MFYSVWRRHLSRASWCIHPQSLGDFRLDCDGWIRPPKPRVPTSDLSRQLKEGRGLHLAGVSVNYGRFREEMRGPRRSFFREIAGAFRSLYRKLQRDIFEKEVFLVEDYAVIISESSFTRIHRFIRASFASGIRQVTLFRTEQRRNRRIDVRHHSKGRF